MSAQSSTLTSPAPAAELRHLRKIYAAGVVALDNLSLSFPKGEMTALLGPNGSGKSTIVRILAGSDRGYEGTARMLGIDLSRSAPGLRSRIGYATQRPALDPELTGMEHLRLFHALRGLPHRNRNATIDRQVEDFGLTDCIDRTTAGYSGGERQRLHLAIETIHSPYLLLLDEPTSSLDPDGRRDLWNYISRLRNGGRTVIVATHDLAEVEAHADRVAILHNGRVRAEDAVVSIVAAHRAAGASVTLETDMDLEKQRQIRERLSAINDIIDIRFRRRLVTVWRAAHGAAAHDPVLDILSELDLAVERYERIHPGLHGVYFRLTGDEIGNVQRRKAEGGRRNQS